MAIESFVLVPRRCIRQAMNELKQIIKNDGGCDHSVGICDNLANLISEFDKILKKGHFLWR